MDNLILFVNNFLEYLIVFIVFAVCIVVAVLVGIKVRKSKNSKEEIKSAAANIEAVAVKQQEA